MAGTTRSTSFDAGVPLRDVQEAASHADPRTTIRYDRGRVSLDRHATCIVAAYVAGAMLPASGPSSRSSPGPGLLTWSLASEWS